MQKIKTKEFWVGIIAFLIGIVGIAVVIMQICYINPNHIVFSSQEESYVIDAVPHRLSYLTYFTNLTLLLFCIYAVIKFIAILFGLIKLKNALNNVYLLMFLAVNEILVFIIYLAITILSGFSLFKYAPTPHNLHDIGTSMFKHFFVTIFAVVYCFCLIRKDSKKIEMKKCLWFLLYPAIYYLIVQIIGRTCYEFKWFPYPFFATDQIWLTIYGTLSNFNYTKAFFILFGIDLVIVAAYILEIFISYLICCKLQKRYRKTLGISPKKLE